MPAYPGLYPSFLVFSPIPRPEGLRAFHKQLAATTNYTGSFTSSFGYLITGYPSTSPPPSSLYKSFLLELVRFRTAWEPSIASSFTPLFIVSAGTGISCHLQGSQLPSHVPTGVILQGRRSCILQCGSLGWIAYIDN